MTDEIKELLANTSPRPWKCEESSHAAYLSTDDFTIRPHWRETASIERIKASMRLIAIAVNSYEANQERIKELEFLLERIVADLPAKRDWLDPDIERAARAALQEKRNE